MRYYAQVVSEALLSDPPQIRGIIDGDTIRRLVAHQGSGSSRTFTFDIIGELTLAELLRRKNRVALKPPKDLIKMRILRIEKPGAVFCPQCGLEMLTWEFWHHYNKFHARRVYWLNSEDWSRLGLPGEYPTPPEQR